MNIKANSDAIEASLKWVVFQRKLTAFLISAAALFSALVIAWSWSIKGYQSQASIVVESVNAAFDRQEFQVLLANTIRTKITDQVLSELLNRTKESISIQSPVLDGDLNRLRKAILVNTVAEASPHSMQIQFSLQGQGSADEQLFLRDFTREFSDALAQGSDGKQFVIQNSELARYRELVDEMAVSVGQLEQKINEVTEICGISGDSSSPGPFRVASHRKEPKDVDLRQVQQKMANLDLEFLRTSAAELKNELNTLAAGNYPYALPKAVPMGTPQPKQLWVLLLLASALGLIIANHYQPFANKGFANLADVSNKLKIPVVAAIPINQRNRNGSLSESSENRKLPWANRITRIAMGWLLAVSVVIGGFCFLSGEIREIFLQNPVDGLARAFWYFRK